MEEDTSKTEKYLGILGPTQNNIDNNIRGRRLYRKLTPAGIKKINC